MYMGQWNKMFESIFEALYNMVWPSSGDKREDNYQRIGCFIGLPILVAVVLALVISKWVGGL